MLENIKSESNRIELDTQNKINSSVSKKENILVDAGAGSGKTYSLIKLLSHLLQKNSRELQSNNQNIMCLTYTNAAADEIKNRLGHNENVLVSTIHERFWNLINIYSAELKSLHLERIRKEYREFETKYKEAEFHGKSTEDKVIKYLNFIAENHESYYNKIDTASAKELPEILKAYFSADELKGNAGKLKDLSKLYLKYNNYHVFLITNQQEQFEAVEYNYQITYDRVLKFQITHNTVLEYTLEFVKRYDVFKRVIIDKFPFVVIDEYQDTEQVAMEIIVRLDEYAQENKINLFIAFFGDKAQQIYDVNHSEESKRYYNNPKFFSRIKKKFNYRSSQKIIDVGNNIRNDDTIQDSPYTDSDFGDIFFKKSTLEMVNTEISETIEEWNINEEDKLHCLFLTNKEIAEYIGMRKVYSTLNEMNYYLSINYKLLNPETLSKDGNKIGESQAVLLRLLKLYCDINDKDKYADDIFPEKLLYQLSVKQIIELQLLFKNNFSKKYLTFKNYLEDFFSLLERNKDNNIGKTLSYYLPVEIENLLSLKIFLSKKFREDRIDKIDSLIEIKFYEYLNWYHYLHDLTTSNSIDYHTYHGVKGLEFENVLIILKPDFHRDKHFFERFFLNYASDNNNDKYVKARNVLYVATTRAIKNLKILYLGDTSNIEENIKKIFTDAGAKVDIS